MCLYKAKPHARFVECGIVSQYNAAKPQGPRAFSQVITMRIRLEGFIVLDHAKDFPKARAELAQWMSEGKLKKSETIIKGGLKVAEQALVDLYKGINTGMYRERRCETRTWRETEKVCRGVEKRERHANYESTRQTDCRSQEPQR